MSGIWKVRHKGLGYLLAVAIIVVPVILAAWILMGGRAALEAVYLYPLWIVGAILAIVVPPLVIGIIWLTGAWLLRKVRNAVTEFKVF